MALSEKVPKRIVYAVAVGRSDMLDLCSAFWNKTVAKLPVGPQDFKRGQIL
jgi:hypothetical protein